MEDSAKHGAEISGGLVSEIVRDRGHRQPHRELLQPEHKPALPSPNRERHAGVAKEKAREGTLAGAGFPAPAFERSIVVGPLTQFLHDTEDATVLPVGHDQRRLSDDRYAVEKKTGQTHFGETGINVPWNVDRYVQQFSTERIEVITDAFGWKRGRDGGRRKEAAKSDDSRIPHPVVDSSRDPYRAVWRRDPNALPCADRGDATDDRDELTSVVSVRANPSRSILVPRDSGNRTVGGVRVRVDRKEVGAGVDVHFVSPSVCVVGRFLPVGLPPETDEGARSGPADATHPWRTCRRKHADALAYFMRLNRLKALREKRLRSDWALEASARQPTSRGRRGAPRFGA